MRASANALLILAAFLVPLQETMHVLLAPHAHRHCPEHHRIEDINPPASPSLASQDGPTYRGDDTQANEHVPCPILNALAGATGDTPRPPGCQPQILARNASAAFPPSRVHTRIILFAPKNSPPLS